MKKIVLLLHLFIAANTNPVVELPNLGKIRGRYDKIASGRTIRSFEGVPYAHPPVGQYRFKEPVPIEPWEGVWEAKTIYRCMQYNQYTPPGQDYVVGDENCLYLNIYSPNLNQSNLDVIVYIHGGSFMFNYGGIYRPDFLLNENVVVITLNYRLGPLGFLSTEDEIVPGNNGMRDQILALKFIKNNVRYFGGNSESITICGNSAGGVSVHFHYLSPKSRNLFHRGLSLSGTTLVPWALMERPLEKTKKIANLVGCSSRNTKDIVECLKTRPARQIVASVKEFQPWLYIPFSPFGLVVDSWASDPTLPEHPYIIMKTKQVYDVPWIVSYTSSEGLYPAEEFYEEHLDDVEAQWNRLIPLILDYNYTVDPHLHDEVSQKIRKKYLGDHKLTKDTFRYLIPLLSDRLFVNGIEKAAILQASAVPSPVYSYQFAYRGASSWFQFENFGAAHADDVPYIFQLKALNTSTTPSDKAMISFFVEMVTSYARTSKPGVPIEWPPLSSSSSTYLKINSPKDLLVETGTSKNSDFWESLPIKENEKWLMEAKDEL